MSFLTELFRGRRPPPTPTAAAAPPSEFADIDVEAVAAAARAMYNPKSQSRKSTLEYNPQNIAMVKGIFPKAVAISRRDPNTGEYFVDVDGMAAQQKLAQALQTSPQEVFGLAREFYGQPVEHLGSESLVTLVDYQLGRIPTRRQSARQLRSRSVAGIVMNLAEDAAGAAAQAALGFLRRP